MHVKLIIADNVLVGHTEETALLKEADILVGQMDVFDTDDLPSVVEEDGVDR